MYLPTHTGRHTHTGGYPTYTHREAYTHTGRLSGASQTLNPAKGGSREPLLNLFPAKGGSRELLLTRFTVWLTSQDPPFHPFHCWGNLSGPLFSHPFHCWFCTPGTPFYHPFHCWFCTLGTQRGYLPTPGICLLPTTPGICLPYTLCRWSSRTPVGHVPLLGPWCTRAGCVNVHFWQGV